MCDGAFPRAEAELPCLDSLTIASPNIDTLPPETIVVHVLPYLTNGEKGALAKTCGRLFRLLRRERVYRLSSPCTRKYFEDAAFREEVSSHIPAGKLALSPFECAVRAFHFAPFDFKRARMLFEEALADESATELEKARANLSLYVLHQYGLGGPNGRDTSVWRLSAERASASLLSPGDEGDPVRAFEMGFCLDNSIGITADYVETRSLNYEKTRLLFASSANGGCAAAMYFLGQCLCLGMRHCPPVAVALWERAAAMGHFGTMALLGTSLYWGSGMPRDEARGVALIRSAAVDEGCWWAKKWLVENEDELKRKGL